MTAETVRGTEATEQETTERVIYLPDAARVIALDEAPGADAPPVATPDETETSLGSDYLKLWTATAVSNLGDGVRIAALPLLAATLTRNPLLISGVLFASKLPWLLFSLHSGAIADRVDRRRLTVLVNVLRALAMGAFGLTLLTGVESLPLLYAIALIQGIGEVFSDNASFALMPSLVPKARLEEANGRLEAAMIVCNEFAGPAIGGLLFALTLGLPFVFDASTFLVAGLLMLSLSYRPAPVQPSEAKGRRMNAEIAEGLRWLRGHRLLRDLTLIAAGTNLVLNATFAIAVLYVLEILGVGEVGFGLLLSAEAFGALAGSLLAARIKRRFGTAWAVTVALGIAGAANLVIGSTSSWVVFGAMAICISFSGGLWNVVTNSLRQSLVPDRLMGRVQSAHRLLSWGAIPVGTLLGGALSQAFGLRAPFLMAAATLLVMSFAVARLLRRSVAATAAV